jgi:hypothetical protein
MRRLTRGAPLNSPHSHSILGQSGFGQGGATVHVAVNLAANGAETRGEVARKPLKTQEYIRDDTISACVFAANSLQMQPAVRE